MNKKKLLLHCCCAPCATSVIERLLNEDEFDITLYFANSNILPQSEYTKRLEELKKLAKIHNLPLVEDCYNPQEFFDSIKGLESLGEGSKRCDNCIYFRLEKTAKYAKTNGYDCFCTTLTVSPHKNAEHINNSGKELSNILNIEFLERDFKKRDGFKRSIELCKIYNIYRQTYCGCGLVWKRSFMQSGARFMW